MAIVYLSLGSNIGDRVGYIQQSTSLLASNSSIKIGVTSSFYETEPCQMESKNWFVNAIIQITTTLSPQDLLNECQRIETLLGRKTKSKNNKYTDRQIDIDILFYDNNILKTDNMTIPHPLAHRRCFVLVPMLEIADDFIHPLFSKTISELYEEIEDPETVYLYGTRF